MTAEKVNTQEEMFELPKSFEWLPVVDLLEYRRTGQGVQRNMILGHGSRIEREFDPRAVGLLVVSRRSDGTLWLLDGQHRAYAMRRRGIELAECIVYDNLTRQEEAALWRMLNRHLATKPLDNFISDLEAGNPKAVEINRVVLACGFRIATYYSSYFSKEGKRLIAAVGALDWIFERGGSSALSDVLTIISDVYADERMAVGIKMLEGLHVFLSVYADQIHRDRLFRVMRATPFDRLLRNADELSVVYGKGRKTLVSLALVALYNKGLKEGYRLDPARLEAFSKGGNGERPRNVRRRTPHR